MNRAVLVAVAATLTLTAAGVQAAASNPIQPGDSTSNCTLDYLYDGADGGVYFGIAGHCVDHGDGVWTDGHGSFGTVVYDDSDHDGGLDIALIEVDQDKVDGVAPHVKGHPDVPTGYTDWVHTDRGDLVGVSGYGIATMWTRPTREERVGPLVSDTAVGYCADTPVSFGDSGGPAFHVESGQALGIVSSIGGCAATLSGPTVQAFLREVGSHGWDLTLRTV